MEKHARIYVAGHSGLVGSALIRELKLRGYTDIVTASHTELDLTRQEAVEDFFETHKPEYVFFAAAKVGGIGANSTYPAEFIYQNIMMAANVLEAAHRSGVRHLINFGSSCIYPRLSPQPIREEYLLTSELEPTNEPYAIAKIAALKMCEAYNTQYGTQFVTLMPTNLYGEGDTYDAQNSHVIPALIVKFHEAKVSGKDEVVLWGDGSPLREFLASMDLARAACRVMELSDAESLGTGAAMSYLNVGSGVEIKIRDLAERVREVVYSDVPGRTCEIVWDTEKPNGTPRKLLDSSKMRALGWRPSIDLANGLALAYQDFLSRTKRARS